MSSAIQVKPRPARIGARSHHPAAITLAPPTAPSALAMLKAAIFSAPIIAGACGARRIICTVIDGTAALSRKAVANRQPSRPAVVPASRYKQSHCHDGTKEAQNERSEAVAVGQRSAHQRPPQCDAEADDRLGRRCTCSGQLCDPEEAAQAAIDLKAKSLLAAHVGRFAMGAMPGTSPCSVWLPPARASHTNCSHRRSAAQSC